MTHLRLELPAPAAARLTVLDELKGVAILLVVAYHAGGVLGLPNNLHADAGVDIFVILSGLGLALGPDARGARPFFLRRFKRIYPTYWLVLTACVLANVRFLQLHYSTANLALHFLGIHGWFGDAIGMSINDSFWFITLIVTLYPLYWILRSSLDAPDKILLWGGAFSFAAAALFFYTGQSGIFAHFALRLPGFFLGLVLGRLLRDGRLELPLSATLAGAFLLFFYVPYTQGIIFGSVPVGLTLLFAYAFLLRPRASEALRRKLRFLGDHSLEIFLVHQPLIREYNVYLLGRWFGIPAPTTGALCVGIAVGLGAALVLSVELHKLTARFR